MTSDFEIGREIERLNARIDHLRTEMTDHSHPHEHDAHVEAINEIAEEIDHLQEQTEQAPEETHEEVVDPAEEAVEEPVAVLEHSGNPDHETAPARVHPLHRRLW